MKKVATILITNEKDDVLFGLRSDNYKWSAPGGHANEGEDIYHCAFRELKEETGLDAVDMRLCKVGISKDGNLMIYVFVAQIDANQSPDISKDPDKEFLTIDYLDPNDIKYDLHVPIEDNLALQYWIEK